MPPADAVAPPRPPALVDAATDRLRLVNVALGKRARQSSRSIWSGERDATAATAGDRGLQFGFHTDHDEAPWWELDLEAALPVHSIALFNRDDIAECAARASHLAVAVSADGVQWTPLIETQALCFGGVRSGYPLTLLLEGRLPMRYLRISLTRPGYLHLAQVEVYAAETVLVEQQLAARHGMTIWTGNNNVRGAVTPELLAAPRFASLTVKLYGRFGNQVTQLIHAGLVAQRLGIDRIHLDEVNPGALRESVVVGGITYDPAPRAADAGLDFQATCFHSAELGDLLTPVLAEAPAQAVRALPALLAPRIAQGRAQPGGGDPRKLVIHLRSGDVFQATNVNADLIQPPMSYYQLALADARQRFGIERVMLVFEDAANPVVGVLGAWLETAGLAVERQSGSFDEDIAALFGAVHMVGGIGTFTEAVAMGSEVLRSRYHLRGHYLTMTGAVLRSKGVRDLAIMDDPAAPYLAAGSWRNSEEQQRVMLQYPIERLRVQEVIA